MSKERELLKRWLAGEANQLPTHVPLLIETQNLLAQPEQPKQEPLSVERIADLWTDINTNSVRNFARAIEKEHGIGGGNE